MPRKQKQDCIITMRCGEMDTNEVILIQKNFTVVRLQVDQEIDIPKRQVRTRSENDKTRLAG